MRGIENQHNEVGGTSRALWASALMTPMVVGWLNWVHHLDGVRVAGAPSLTAQWLRDTALAMPVVALAATALAWLGRRAFAGSDVPAGIARAGLLGGGVSAVLAGLVPLHHRLFGASWHHGRSLPIGQAFVRDLVLAVAVLVPAALLLQLWSALAPAGFDPSGLRRLARQLTGPVGLRVRRRAIALGLGFGLVLSGSLAGQAIAAAGPVAGTAALTGPAPLATDPGNPCPQGAPAKSFDVQAIDLKIPLNRFGDNDPAGKMYALSSRISAIRAQEASQVVTSGLRDDPIQPLVVRANLGDCVTVTFSNNATGGDYGIHIDGLAFAVGSSGDSIGRNPSSEVATGGSTTYRFYVPNDVTLEGAHYLHPGPGYRAAVDHGLFGSLAIEPAGSTYRNPTTGAAQISGWEADILPGNGKKAFREAVKIMHEVGNDNETVSDKDGVPVPLQDNTTGSYRAGAFALNYRSEPFRNRLLLFPTEKSHGYSSYVFGDPATPMPRGYLADPTKFRILHAGGEKFHVYHLHGGGDRWRANPHEDTTFDYEDTGLRKDPPVESSRSQRLDSQSTGPGESYDLEIEGGAGGVQQSSGDFLYHCHIAKHYTSGMWSVWRVFDARQADLQPLPDRAPLPAGVPATGLVGKQMPDGTTLTAQNLDQWIRPMLPPQGVGRNDQDAAVWNWSIDPQSGNYLGEPEDPTLTADSLSRYTDPAHPNRMAGDVVVGNRPQILFNPDTGRPVYPLLRTHVGKRPPFTANGHSGAPYLGENADAAKPAAGIDPFAKRTDGLCPQGRRLRTFNVVAIDTPVPVTKTTTDPEGKLFVLAKNVAKVRSGQMPAEPLAIRTNVGDCAAVTLTNEMPDAGAFDGFSKTTMHIHHVQFDVQGSDGVTAGFAYEHSVRPYQVEDPQLTVDALTGATSLTLANAAKFQAGSFIGVGLGTDGIEIRKIGSISGSTVTLTEPLAKDHPAGQWAGTEFIQYRWYPDVLLDNVFWHDHVDGIHGWGHGLVGQLIVEPKGSTYHDPKTGAEVDSGTLVDIRTNNPLAAGVVDGSFRELALWQINDNDKIANSSFNLRMEPFADRTGPVANRFSSYGPNGDPFTPLPQAYPGDPVVIRSISVSPTVDTLHVQGGRFITEFRSRYNGQPTATLTDTLHAGISEKYTLVLNGKDATARPGDKLYFQGNDFRTRMGAWGIIRVLPQTSPDVQPLPDNPAPGGSWTTPVAAAPPATTDPGNPCPNNAPVHSFAVSSVDLSGSGGDANRGFARAALVPTAQAGSAAAGDSKVEPLVLHVAEGECVEVTFTNSRTPDPLDPALPRSSFSVAKLDRTSESSGVNVGYSTEQTVGPGGTRVYRYFADSARLGSAAIADFGADATGKAGLYGAVVVAPAGAGFTDPVSGASKDIGSQVDVHVPGGTPAAYRDFTVAFADDDAKMSQDLMPYPTDARPNGLGINYRAAPVGDGRGAFSSYPAGDPATPILKSFPGDPVLVHALGSPGSEQTHSFNLGGLAWSEDPFLSQSQKLTTRALGPWETIDAKVAGGGGGWAKTVGDFFYGDLRRPFTQQGMWGLQRVVPIAGCELRLLGGGPCNPTPLAPVIDGFAPPSGLAGALVTLSGTGFTTATAVTFSGAAAVAPTVLSDVELRVLVPADARTGTVQVTNPSGTGTSSASFTVIPAPIPAPVVASFAPGSGPVGTAVTLTGSHFTGATGVAFGGVPATFTVGSDTSIAAVVPAGAVTGSIVVTGPGGTGAGPTSFLVTVLVKPVINGLTPSSGPVGVSVIISGSRFNGALAVDFNGTPAIFSVISSTLLSTVVPPGATTGPLSVTTTAGTTAGPIFTVTVPPPAPTITGFSPKTGITGTTVTITGTNFTGATKVTLAGVNCPVFSVVSATRITVKVPANGKTGKFKVITPGGSALTKTNFVKV